MRTKRRFFAVALAVLAAALMGMGLFRVTRVYKRYREDMLTYESRHLNSIVSTSARGLEWMLSGYQSQIAALVERGEFGRAEARYAETGDLAVMRQLMNRPDVLQQSMPYSMGVYDGQGAFLAASDDSFPAAGEDTDFGDGVLLRQAADGVFWFVFREDSALGFRYELAVPVRTLFSYHADGAKVGRHGYLFLLDERAGFFAYSGGGDTVAVSAAQAAEDFPDMEPSALVALSQRGITSPEDYEVYRYPWRWQDGDSDGGGKADETLVVTYALSLGQGRLIMGAAVSFEEFNAFLSNILNEVALVICMELGGAIILLVMAAWMFTLNRRDALELAAVREKADLMEEINRQQQSLAHTERLQQLGVMTSGIVHECNNMLTPIMSQSLLLLEQLADQENSPQFENALDIYEASEKARDVLRRMSSMSKKDVDMGFKTIELGGLLRKTLALASMAKDPHIQQELFLPKEPVYVSGNEQLLTQAFLNLCINACQAMGTEGTLSIVAERESRSGRDYVRVEVRDTGAGIEESSLGSIYDPFFTTKGEQGTGLGLAICQKIIETHKGTISAANRPEGGAVFTVRLPVTGQPE